MNLRAFLALAAACALFSGCSNAEKAADTTAGVKDTLIFAAPADATTLAPHNTTDNQSDQVILMLYDTLIAFDDRMQIVGRLSDRWSVASDGITWSFHLRSGVRFHDGTPFTALSVKRNFDRVLDPVRNHKRLPLFNMSERVEVVDDQNVRIITKYPFSAFEPTMAHVSAAIVNPGVAEREGKAFGATADATSGTGPYKVVRWKKDLEIVLERNDDHWGEKGRLRRVIYRPIPEASSRIVALEVGDVDAITSVPPADMVRLEKSPKVRILKTVSVGAQQFRFKLRAKALYGSPSPPGHFIRDRPAGHCAESGVDLRHSVNRATDADHAWIREARGDSLRSGEGQRTAGSGGLPSRIQDDDFDDTQVCDGRRAC